jgi:CheY-like chemotaxis protein
MQQPRCGCPAPPDLILTDVMLSGTDGLELASRHAAPAADHRPGILMYGFKISTRASRCCGRPASGSTGSWATDEVVLPGEVPT